MKGIGKAVTILWKHRQWLLIAVMVVLVVNASRLAAVRIWPPKPVAPSHELTSYTVVLTAISYEEGREPQVRWQETHAVRHDGAYARRDQGVGTDGVAYVRRDLFFPSGERISTDDVAEVMEVWPLADPWRHLRDPNSNCVNARNGEPMASSGMETVVGRGEVHGYQVVQIRGRRATSSYAPALGCAMLYGTTQGNAPAYMTKELSTIVPGEPDPALFTVPATFRLLSSRPSGDTNAITQ